MTTQDHHILDAATSGVRQGGPSFPLAHRLLRALFSTVWLLAAAWTPPPFHAWRAQVLRLFGARIGCKVRIHGSACIWYPPHLTLGDNAVIGPGVVCYCIAPVSIGAGAIISQRAHLCTGTHDVDDPAFQLQARPIVIGPRAWVAAEAFVGPGVTLGEGAVLAARAVTFKDLPAWTIHAGNPATFLRNRRPH